MTVLDVRDHLSTTADPVLAGDLFAAIHRARALVPGHFALQRNRHVGMAIRFRAFAHDPAALELAATALVAQARWDWSDVTIVSPESAGFFLGARVAELVSRPHAVVRTDLRRLATDRLVFGAIPASRPVVIVNDVASTGVSLDPIRELVTRSEAVLRGILVFAVVGVPDFQAYGTRWNASVGWSVTARWAPVAPGPESCAGCRAAVPLVPIADLS